MALKRLAGNQFTDIDATTWRLFAERSWTLEGGKLVANYDPHLSKLLEQLDLEKPLPVLWPYFDTLKHVPVLSIRGSNSDLFAQATQNEMVRRHPNCTAYVVPGQGHAPLLADRPSIAKIVAFCQAIDF